MLYVISYDQLQTKLTIKKTKQNSGRYGAVEELLVINTIKQIINNN